MKLKTNLPILAILLLTSSIGCFRKSIPADDWMSQKCKGISEEPAKIGVLLPLSGKYQLVGETVLSGIQMAVFESQIELIVRDTGAEPQQATNELEKLVNEHKVAAILGPMLRDVSMACALKAVELGIPLITLTGREDLTAIDTFVFRHFLSRNMVASTIAEYAVGQLGLKRFAVVHPEDSYGKAYLEIFQKEIQQRGGSIVKIVDYSPESNNLTKAAKKLVDRLDLTARPDFIKKRKHINWKYRNSPLQRDRALQEMTKKLRPIVEFDAVFVPDSYEKVALFAPALAAQDVGLKSASKSSHQRMKKSLGRNSIDLVYLFGTEGWNHPDLVRWAGRHLQGAIFGDSFFVESSQESTRNFVSAYRKQYKKLPDRLTAHAFDAATILFNQFSSPPPCNSLELIDKLIDLRNFEGVTGKTHFKDGEAIIQYYLLEIQNNKIVEKQQPKPVS